MNAGDESTGRVARACWLLFVVAWLVHVGCSLIGWDHTLLNRFQFRQVQTAIAALFHPPGLPQPDYVLPLFGPPWEAPLEFPVYQAAVATVAHTTGLSLDPSGRLVSWLLFQSALPALALILGSLGVARQERPLFLALLVASPIYLFFSRCFLIESTALALSLWFLAAFLRWVPGGGVGWLALAALAGAGAAAVKLPTFAIVVGAGALSTVARLRTPAGHAARLGIAARAALTLLAPLAAALAWQSHAARLRILNPETAFLDSMFGYFGFGDLALRLSPEFWASTFAVWTDGLIGEGGLLLALLGLVWAPPARRWLAAGSAVAFLSGQLVFANLYFVHDYYFYANGWLLLVAAGCGLSALLRAPALPVAVRVGLVALVLALQFVTYARHYLPEQRRDTPVPELTRVVERLTGPDDVIVVLGHDWDAAIPYYAQRRALMLTSGRERDPAAIARSVSRLDPARVGAVLLFGEARDDTAFAASALAALDLGPTPLLLGTTEKVGVWFPRDRHAAVRDLLPADRYRTLAIVAPRPSDGVQVLGQREIQQLAEFDALGTRPLRARTQSGFAVSQVDGHRVLNAHPPTDLAFRAPATGFAVDFSFGLVDAAYANPSGATDGAEFVWLWRGPDGVERVLFSRLLDPAARAEDRGRQRGGFEGRGLPPGGELLFRILPGPAGNGSFDWSYVGDIQIRTPDAR